MALRTNSGSSGFTILELLVVMAIIGTLLSLAAPHYFRSIDKAKQAALRENLVVLRHTLDHYYADQGVYPSSLQELVSRRYLRSIPQDPVTASAATWLIVGPSDKAMGGVADVRSGAAGKGDDGVPYGEW